VVDPSFARTNTVQNRQPVVILIKRVFVRSAGKVFREELAAAGGTHVSVAIQIYSGLGGQGAEA